MTSGIDILAALLGGEDVPMPRTDLGAVDEATQAKMKAWMSRAMTDDLNDVGQVCMEIETFHRDHHEALEKAIASGDHAVEHNCFAIKRLTQLVVDIGAFRFGDTEWNAMVEKLTLN